MHKGNAHVGVVFLEPKLCPNNCGSLVLARDFESHVANICALRKEHCPEGCGILVLGKDLRAHAKTCGMGQLCERAERSLQERSLKELKLALAGMYGERDAAAARHISNGGTLVRKGWATGKLATRVARVESAMRDLVIRCRRKAKDHLILARATTAFEGKQPAAGAPSAFKQLDSVMNIDRSARPWDLSAPGLADLMDALEEASICGGLEQLRMDCESVCLAMLRRLLEAAMLTSDCDILEEVCTDAAIALQLIELSGINDIPNLIRQARHALHCAALAEVPDHDETIIAFVEGVKTGDLEYCTWLFDREMVDPSSADERTDFPAIMIAARNGDLPMCELLLNRKADVNMKCDIDGFSALHWAAHKRNSRVVDLLLAGKANPRLKDKKGQDSLMKLVRRDLNIPAAGCSFSWDMQPFRRLPGPRLQGSGFVDFEDAKVAAEAIPECVGISFRSIGGGPCNFTLRGPVGMAPPPKRPEAQARAQKKASTRRKSRRKDEDEDEQEESDEDQSESPEEEARREKAEDEEDEAFWTTYLRVATNPAHDVIAMLAAGADASAQDFCGLSTLHHHLLSAPSRGSYDVVAALVQAQVDVNVMCETARSATPLMLVVASKRADLLKLMLDDAWPPADVDARTCDGVSMLEQAEERGTREVFELLKGAGASIWSDADACFGFEEHSNFFCDTRFPVGAEA